MVSRTLFRSALALLLLPALAFAQEDHIRRVLQGENATLVFGPNGGYSAQNYLKKYEATAGPTPGEQWATQNGVLAEMIRRATPGSKVLIAAFRCDEREVMDALFEVVKKNVTVKMWLKGPPGLTYMVDGHKQIAARANEYLRARAAQNKQAEWGDFQVMLGTAAQMSAYGKINDMHEKFGVIDLVPEGGAGHNHSFLGTSNIGASSDRSHNESRLFFHSNPQAAQALWKEFARLWTHLGTCETFVDGTQSAGVNATPERPEAARIRLEGGGGFADEGPGDVLQFRFTYEREGVNGPFHRITEDFVQALNESTALPQGSIVWIGQFGFQIHEITQALLKVARAAPHVEYRVMVHMGEAETGDVRRLVEAKLPNLKCGIKWDSGKLVLDRGSRPSVPGVESPGPALLHHKTLIVGDRLMITGSFNFFPDADDQGEGVVIIRNHLAPTYAHVLADSRAEFEALWRSPVLMDAALVHAAGGLMDTIEDLSDDDGFLETLGAVGTEPKTAAAIAAVAGVSAQDADRFLAALERFDFVQKDGDGRFYRAEPDVVAHAAKGGVRAAATEAPDQPDPPPPAGPTEGTVRGRVVSVAGGVARLQGADAAYAVSGAEVVKTLALLVGRDVEVEGTITPAGAGAADVAARQLVSPVRGLTTGVVVRDAGQLYLRVGDARGEAFGPAAAVLGRAVGRQVKVDGYALADSICVLAVEAESIKSGRITKNFVAVGMLQRGRKVWVSKLASNGSQSWVEHQNRAGYFPTVNLAFGVAVPGLVNALPGQ